MTEWQQIATIPRDGTEVLLTDGEHRTCGCWSKDPFDPERTGDGLIMDWPLFNQPTHWMPLPPPPSADEPAAETEIPPTGCHPEAEAKALREKMCGPINRLEMPRPPHR